MNRVTDRKTERLQNGLFYGSAEIAYVAGGITSEGEGGGGGGKGREKKKGKYARRTIKEEDISRDVSRDTEITAVAPNILQIGSRVAAAALIIKGLPR